jgi:DNA-directed RNA polymerase specialized sigma24 family protein
MPEPITRYIHELEQGQRQAAQGLWEHYARRLVPLARQMLKATPRGMADEEDLAQSAFASACCGIEGGRFPQLEVAGRFKQPTASVRRFLLRL